MKKFDKSVFAILLLASTLLGLLRVHNPFFGKELYFDLGMPFILVAFFNFEFIPILLIVLVKYIVSYFVFSFPHIPLFEIFFILSFGIWYFSFKTFKFVSSVFISSVVDTALTVFISNLILIGFIPLYDFVYPNYIQGNPIIHVFFVTLPTLLVIWTVTALIAYFLIKIHRTILYKKNPLLKEKIDKNNFGG